MRTRHWIVAWACVLLLAGSAGAQTLYFMRDADEGPAVDGVLSWHPPPPPPNPDAPEQTTPPDVRTLLPLVPTQFFTEDAQNNTGRLRGVVILGLWTPDMATTDNATLLVELVQAPAADLPVRSDVEVLASSTMYLRPGNLTPPEPSEWVPTDPTDPEGAVDHITAHAVSYALPMLLQPPYVLVMTGEDRTPLDLEVPLDVDVGIRITLLGSDGEPVPRSLGQAIEYDFALAPSFVYMPWYVEPEPKETTTKTTSKTTSTSPSASGRPTLGPGEDEDRDEDAPAVPVVLLVAALGLAALRRRVR